MFHLSPFVAATTTTKSINKREFSIQVKRDDARDDDKVLIRFQSNADEDVFFCIGGNVRSLLDMLNSMKYCVDEVMDKEQIECKFEVNEFDIVALPCAEFDAVKIETPVCQVDHLYNTEWSQQSSPSSSSKSDKMESEDNDDDENDKKKKDDDEEDRHEKTRTSNNLSSNENATTATNDTLKKDETKEQKAPVNKPSYSANQQTKRPYNNNYNNYQRPTTSSQFKRYQRDYDDYDYYENSKRYPDSRNKRSRSPSPPPRSSAPRSYNKEDFYNLRNVSTHAVYPYENSYTPRPSYNMAGATFDSDKVRRDAYQQYAKAYQNYQQQLHQQQEQYRYNQKAYSSIQQQQQQHQQPPQKEVATDSSTNTTTTTTTKKTFGHFPMMLHGSGPFISTGPVTSRDEKNATNQSTKEQVFKKPMPMNRSQVNMVVDQSKESTPNERNVRPLSYSSQPKDNATWTPLNKRPFKFKPTSPDSIKVSVTGNMVSVTASSNSTTTTTTPTPTVATVKDLPKNDSKKEELPAHIKPIVFTLPTSSAAINTANINTSSVSSQNTLTGGPYKKQKINQ